MEKDDLFEDKRNIQNRITANNNEINEDINKREIIVKSSIVVLSLAAIIMNCYLGYGLPNTNIQCMNDTTHTVTEKINLYLNKNIQIRNIIIILSSLYEDLIMITMCVYWIFKIKSWRVVICILIFYIFRGIIQMLFQMRYPEGYSWDYPGFPSLIVSYLRTNDFFYSGHVGLPIIIACEFFKNNKHSLGYFSLCCCLVEFTVMLIMRGHYIIDLIFGIIIAHYIFIIVDKKINYSLNPINKHKELLTDNTVNV
jgi:hypothetical protein